MSCRQAAALFFSGLLALGLSAAGEAIAAPGAPSPKEMSNTERQAIALHVPGDYSTIQAAIDAARPGDTILVGAGEYEESLEIRNCAGLTLSGAGAIHTIVRSEDTVLRVQSTPSLRIEGFRFESSAEVALQTRSSGIDFRYNVVVADAPSGQAHLDIRCLLASEFVRNTFIRPNASSGPFLRINPDPCSMAGPVSVRRNLFWTWGKPVADYTGHAIITQNNLGITPPEDYPPDNMFEFPLFCDPGNRIYTLSPGSPCLPENNVWGRTIGALSAGCGPVGVESASWGRIKNSYR